MRRTWLPKPTRPVAPTSAKSISTRGPRLKLPMLRPGSVVITPRIVNVALPIASRSPTRTSSAVSSSGRTSAPELRSSACE